MMHPNDKVLKTYHRHGHKYTLMCDGRYHWVLMHVRGLGNQLQARTVYCPTTCKHHRFLTWEKKP